MGRGTEKAGGQRWLLAGIHEAGHLVMLWRYGVAAAEAVAREDGSGLVRWAKTAQPDAAQLLRIYLAGEAALMICDTPELFMQATGGLAGARRQEKTSDLYRAARLSRTAREYREAFKDAWAYLKGHQQQLTLALVMFHYSEKLDAEKIRLLYSQMDGGQLKTGKAAR